MNLLLDTCIFLWLISGDNRLSISIREKIRDPENEVFLSTVSIWESLVKHQIGRLPLPYPPAEYLPAQRKRHNISSLPLDEGSVVNLSNLPLPYFQKNSQKKIELPRKYYSNLVPEFLNYPQSKKGQAQKPIKKVQNNRRNVPRISPEAPLFFSHLLNFSTSYLLHLVPVFQHSIPPTNREHSELSPCLSGMRDEYFKRLFECKKCGSLWLQEKDDFTRFRYYQPV